MPLKMKDPSHPGRVFKGLWLDGLNLNVTETAKILGVTRPTLSKLINGKAAFSPEMAIRVSKAFGSTPAFWLRMQLSYNLAQVEKKASAIKIKRYPVPKDYDAEAGSELR